MHSPVCHMPSTSTESHLQASVARFCNEVDKVIA
nr:MAG TPA: hypothetical protein [Caudoviricetes sp.]